MTCRATPLNTTATSAARITSGLADSQIQSLFHELKREGHATNAPDPTVEEYEAGLDRLIMTIRYSDELTDVERERLLGYAWRTQETPPPDGATWHAINNINAFAHLTSERQNNVLDHAAAQMRLNPKRLRHRYKGWLATDTDFEQVTAADPQYAYTPDRFGLPNDKATERALRKLGYETYLAQRHPVFVYGTLRQGQGNDGLMEPAVSQVTPATLKGVGIYGGHFGFPYAAEHPDPEAVTVGELVNLTSDWEGDQARDRLDQLEGFNSDWPTDSHYERVLVTVTHTSEDGSVVETPTWTYLARGSARARLNESDRIVEGDWVAARRNRPQFRRHR